ncbi:hypothetical protein GCM10009808_00180 [Microbacterium sediminicola]|uniref:Glycosyltransferase 2-like domain-containing protein n=1 Tax=Microbacterium sediminicola TaxID=415210 RepID=A0ABP4TF63_9MICO
MTTAAILLVNFFSTDRVSAILNDLSAQPGASELIISIVDNSMDACEGSELSRLCSEFERTFRRIVLTVSKENRGYAGGNNLAFYAVSGFDFDVVMVINPDVRISAGSISEMSGYVARDERQIVVPAVMGPGGSGDGRAAMDRWTGRSVQLSSDRRLSRRWLAYPGGHFMAMAKSLWIESDGLSEEYFLYCEEADLFLRMSRRGAHIATYVGLTVGHESGVTTGSSGGSKSRITLFHAARSRAILYRRHRELWVFLPAMLGARLAFALSRLPRLQESFATASGLWAGLNSAREPSYVAQGRG